MCDTAPFRAQLSAPGQAQVPLGRPSPRPIASDAATLRECARSIRPPRCPPRPPCEARATIVPSAWPSCRRLAPRSSPPLPRASAFCARVADDRACSIRVLDVCAHRSTERFCLRGLGGTPFKLRRERTEPLRSNYYSNIMCADRACRQGMPTGHADRACRQLLF